MSPDEIRQKDVLPRGLLPLPHIDLASVEDFTQFEQRTAYFNGDQVSAQSKRVNLPDRFDQVPMMPRCRISSTFRRLRNLTRPAISIREGAARRNWRERQYCKEGPLRGMSHFPDRIHGQQHARSKLERFYRIGRTEVAMDLRSA
jgi:hypothetical protein